MLLHQATVPVLISPTVLAAILDSCGWLLACSSATAAALSSIIGARLWCWGIRQLLFVLANIALLMLWGHILPLLQLAVARVDPSIPMVVIETLFPGIQVRIWQLIICRVHARDVGHGCTWCAGDAGHAHCRSGGVSPA